MPKIDRSTVIFSAMFLSLLISKLIWSRVYPRTEHALFCTFAHMKQDTKIRRWCTHLTPFLWVYLLWLNDDEDDLSEHKLLCLTSFATAIFWFTEVLDWINKGSKE